MNQQEAAVKYAASYLRLVAPGVKVEALFDKEILECAALLPPPDIPFEKWCERLGYETDILAAEKEIEAKLRQVDPKLKVE